jgi:hypothetical protein
MKTLLEKAPAVAFWRYLFLTVSGLVEQINPVVFLFEVQYNKTPVSELITKLIKAILSLHQKCSAPGPLYTDTHFNF